MRVQALACNWVVSGETTMEFAMGLGFILFISFACWLFLVFFFLSPAPSLCLFCFDCALFAESWWMSLSMSMGDGGHRHTNVTDKQVKNHMWIVYTALYGIAECELWAVSAHKPTDTRVKWMKQKEIEKSIYGITVPLFSRSSAQYTLYAGYERASAVRLSLSLRKWFLSIIAHSIHLFVCFM